MIKKPCIIAVTLLSLSSKEMLTGPALNTKRMIGIPGPDDKETMIYRSHPVISFCEGNVYWASTEYQENDWDTRT